MTTAETKPATKPLPVFIMDRTPGAEGRTTSWEEICKGRKPFAPIVLIQHCTYLDEEWSTSNRCRHRSRQFVVRDQRFRQLSSHYTLEAAEKAAAKFAADLADMYARFRAEKLAKKSVAA